MSIIDELLQLAQSIRAEGELMPILAIEGDENIICGVPWPKNSSDRARLLAKLGGTLGYGFNAHTATIVSDVWWVQRKDLSTEQGERILPSEQPDRREAILAIEYKKSDQEHPTVKVVYYGYSIDDPNVVVFEEPKLWGGDEGDSYKDNTFKYFFQAMESAERMLKPMIDAFPPDYIFPDTGRTPLEGTRIAAREVAFQLGLEILADHREDKDSE